MGKENEATRGPVKKYRIGRNELAIFSNNGSGHNFVIQNGYKKDNEWVNQRISVFGRGLQEIAMLIDKAKEDFPEIANQGIQVEEG